MDFTEILKSGAATAAAVVTQDGELAYAVLPEGYEIHDLETYLETPRRASAHPDLTDVTSFCRYVKTFLRVGSIIFADPKKFTMHAVIDYHTLGAPAHAEHRVSFAAPLSREWQTWRGNSGKPMAQASFAEFIENNLPDIRKPAAADMMEIANELTARREENFTSTVNLGNNSRQFTSNVTVSGATTTNKLDVPTEFTLGIPVFLFGKAYEVTARLRYRMSDGKLSLWYDLFRPEYIEQAAFADIVTIVTTETGITPLMGAAG